MERVKVISYGKNGMVEVVVRESDGHRKDGTQKYSSKTMHVHKDKVKNL